MPFLQEHKTDPVCKPGPTSALSVSAKFLIAVLIVVIPTLAVCGIRVAALVSKGQYVDGDCEASPIYCIWKVQEGYPLYEFPNAGTYSVTFYNRGFYYFYAAVLDWAGHRGEDIVFYGRMLTLFLAFVGGCLTFSLVKSLSSPVNVSPMENLLIALFAFFIWFGSSSSSWFIMSVRPDILSIAVGLAAVLIYTQSSNVSCSRCFLVSLVFFLAWFVKQSTIGMLVGTSLHLILCDRRPSRIASMLIPCFLLMMACLYEGGDAYRFNILKVPSLSRISLSSGEPKVLLQSVLSNAFFWAFPCAIVIGVLARNYVFRRANKNLNSVVASRIAIDLIPPLMFPAMVSAGWCIVGLFRHGAAKNTLLEGYICLATYSVALFMRNRHRVQVMFGTNGVTSVLIAIASMTVFPTAQLAFPDKLGNLTISTEEQHDASKALAAFVDHIPKPAYIEDGMLSEPWYSTNGQYPAVVLDIVFYYDARAHGWMENGGVDELIAKHSFRSLLIRGRPVSRETALKCGYQLVPFPEGMDSMGLELLELEPTIQTN